MVTYLLRVLYQYYNHVITTTSVFLQFALLHCHRTLVGNGVSLDWQNVTKKIIFEEKFFHVLRYQLVDVIESKQSQVTLYK